MNTPRIQFAEVSAVAFGIIGRAAEPSPQVEKATVKLVSGETMTGAVGSVRDGSLSLITDYGPVRIPVDKLTEESRTKLGITDKVDVASLQKRITELEDLVARLREENANVIRWEPCGKLSSVSVFPRNSATGEYFYMKSFTK